VISSLIWAAKLSLSLHDRSLQRHAGEVLRVQEPARLSVIHEHTHNNARYGTLRRVRRMGAAKIRSAPAGIRQVDQHIRALHLAAR